MRVGLAATVLWSLVAARGYSIPKRHREWRAYLVMGWLANVLPFALFSWGQRSITAGMASMLNATTPMFTLLAVRVFHSKEPSGLRRLSSVGVGLAGVACLLMSNSVESSDRGMGQLAALGAAACYAAGAVFCKRFCDQPPLVNAAAMLTCSAVSLAPFALVIEQTFYNDVPQPEQLDCLSGVVDIEHCSRLPSLLRIAQIFWGHFCRFGHLPNADRLDSDS